MVTDWFWSRLDIPQMVNNFIFLTYIFTLQQVLIRDVSRAFNSYSFLTAAAPNCETILIYVIFLMKIGMPFRKPNGLQFVCDCFKLLAFHLCRLCPELSPFIMNECSVKQALCLEYLLDLKLNPNHKWSSSLKILEK